MKAPEQASAQADTRRKLANAFIAAFVAYQIGMPLTYYLSERVYDERFSWRMFSTVRLQECAISVTETLGEGERALERPVAVGQDVQVAWANVLKRLRPAVIEKYLARRCEQAGGDEVRKVTLVGTCTSTRGETLPERRFERVCREGVTREQAAVAEAGAP